MSILIFSNLCYSLSDGTEIFTNLSGSLKPGVTALVGRNGAGKSCLASILSGHLTSSSGQVQRPASIKIFQQQDSDIIEMGSSIAEFLGVKAKLEALTRVAKGDYFEPDFDIIGNDWDLEAQCQALLNRFQIPYNLNDSCEHLSGGERVKLKLWQCFSAKADCLILDEPSNHLDDRTRQWLTQEIRRYPGPLLVISHEKRILDTASTIWSLNSLGLHEFTGSYDDFIIEQQLQNQAIDNRLIKSKAEEKRLHKQAEIVEQRAAQREKQGKRLKGSQPNILLGAKKRSAESSTSGRIKQRNRQMEIIQNELSELKSQQEQTKPQFLQLTNSIKTRKLVRHLENLQIPYGSQRLFNLNIYSNDLIHVKGNNGSGKSSFLKVLLGHLTPKNGHISGQQPLIYLDQHYSIIKQELSLLENLQSLCLGHTETEYRTALSGIGFRRDKVHNLCKLLSGGEKMKLAMLIVTLQSEASFLLLDEPDNHLDMESKQILIGALKNYSGGFCLVSHDQWFVEQLGIERVVNL